jgi:hypothetical protein
MLVGRLTHVDPDLTRGRFLPRCNVPREPLATADRLYGRPILWLCVWISSGVRKRAVEVGKRDTSVTLD